MEKKKMEGENKEKKDVMATNLKLPKKGEELEKMGMGPRDGGGGKKHASGVKGK